VHNRHVVEQLRAAGAVFVEELTEVPSGARVIFSAHGVSPAVRAEAVERNLDVIDATCPLVTKVHLEAVRFARQGYTILLIGHRDHDEVVGTMGEAPDCTIVVATEEEAETVTVADPSRVAYLTQTTLSLEETTGIVDRLKQRFPAMREPPAQDICYATENRQTAVKAVAAEAGLLLVVGSKNSSNSRRLVEVGLRAGTQAFLVDDETEVRPEWMEGVHRVVVTAGASAPENLVQRVIASLDVYGFHDVEEVQVKDEDVRFGLPEELGRQSGLIGIAAT